MRRAPSTVVAPALLAAVLGACGGTSADADDGLMTALCAAVDAPDGATAASRFETDVHTPLHTLADEITAVDRSLTTALLEAKYDVETVVRDDTDAPDAVVRQRLEVLAEHTRAALEALDRPAPAC